MGVLTRERLAKKLGRSLRTVRRLEQMQAIPPAEMNGVKAEYEEDFSNEVAQWPDGLDRIVILGKKVIFHWEDGSCTERPSRARPAKE
jgi:hypothetical protein